MQANQDRTRKMLTTFALIATGCLGCSDRTPSVVDEPGQGVAGIYTEVRCVANLSARSLSCEDLPAAGGSRRSLYGTNQVKLTSSNVHYDSATQIFAFDVNVKNLLSVTIGTTTGLDTAGVKPFFETGPAVTAYRAPGDTGTIFVSNPDGRASFTGANQAYFLYLNILPTNGVTANRRWELHCPPTVSTFSFILRVFTRSQVAPGVGVNPPSSYTISDDSLHSLYSRLLWDHSRGSGPYPRAVVLVVFKHLASADEREAAINQSGAQYVGGKSGTYMLVVSDDSTGTALWTAIDRLRALPQVGYAGPDPTLTLVSNYQIPNDGPNWEKGDWRLTPDSADGKNWALEAIGAPWAWGCESNGDAAHAAVVDYSWHHSYWVSSVLAERGDDGRRTTGVAWNTNLLRLDASRDSTVTDAVARRDSLAADLRRAIDSADVINLSWGKGFVTALKNPRLPHTSGHGFTTDSTDTANLFEYFRNVISEAEAATNRKPLYVIAAGNTRNPAWWSGLPLLKNDSVLGSRVVVVGGTSNNYTDSIKAWSPWTSGLSVDRGSNYGPLVEIYAPARNITMWDSLSNQAITESGTSFSAPLVDCIGDFHCVI